MTNETTLNRTYKQETIPEVACAVCREKSLRKSIPNIENNGVTYTIYECTRCRIHITHPLPSVQELARLYSSGNYRTTKGKRFNSIIERIIYYLTVRKKRRIEHFIKKGRILDIGCGRGLFLNIMKKNGWEVTGKEFNDETASHARETYGIDVRTGPLKDCGFKDASFDVININHVLEHLFHPDEKIAECYRLLKPGGLLITAVPNIDSLQAKFGRGSWFQLDLPFHIFHFTEKGLRGLLNKHSFKVGRGRHFIFEYNPFGWLQTLCNVLGIRHNLLYDLLKSKNLQQEDHYVPGIKDLALTVVLLPVYLPLSLCLSLFESFILKQGGTIEVYSIKE